MGTVIFAIAIIVVFVKAFASLFEKGDKDV